MSPEKIKVCLFLQGEGFYILENAVSEPWAFCHSQKSMRALNSTVLPGSKEMVIVFEEYLLLHLKMDSLAYDIQGYGEGLLIVLALRTYQILTLKS